MSCISGISCWGVGMGLRDEAGEEALFARDEKREVVDVMVRVLVFACVLSVDSYLHNSLILSSLFPLPLSPTPPARSSATDPNVSPFPTHKETQHMFWGAIPALGIIAGFDLFPLLRCPPSFPLQQTEVSPQPARQLPRTQGSAPNTFRPPNPNGAVVVLNVSQVFCLHRFVNVLSPLQFFLTSPPPPPALLPPPPPRSATDPSVPSNLRGKYRAFCPQHVNPSEPQNLSHGLKHLSELRSAGLNHIHLLPSYDYGSVPEREEEQAVLQVQLPGGGAQGVGFRVWVRVQGW